MKLYRYMSKEEFQKMSSGMPMVPRRGHFAARTVSKGFCFLGEKTTFEASRWDEDCNFDGYETVIFTPEKCLAFLNGIVDADILVEFEAEETEIAKSWGTYSNPIDQEDTMDIIEYCTPTYDRDRFVPLRYAIPHDACPNQFNWYPFN